MNWTGWFENLLSFLKMAASPPPPPQLTGDRRLDILFVTNIINFDIILYPTARLSHNILLIFYFKTAN